MTDAPPPAAPPPHPPPSLPGGYAPPYLAPARPAVPQYGPPPAPNPNQGTGAGKVILIISLVLIGFCFVSMVGVVILGNTVGTTTTTAPPGLSADQGRRADRPAPMGTTFEVAKGWRVTTVSGSIDADAELKAMSPVNVPAPGKRFVSVVVKVELLGDSPEALFTNVELDLLSPTGATVPDSFAVLDDGLDITTQLQPRGTVTGRLVWEVPIADAPKSVLLAQPTFTIDPAEDQRFYALAS